MIIVVMLAFLAISLVSLSSLVLHRDVFTEFPQLSETDDPVLVELKQIETLTDTGYVARKIRGKVKYLNPYTVVFSDGEGVRVLGAITLKAQEGLVSSPRDGIVATAHVVVGGRVLDNERMSSRLMLGSRLRNEWNGRPIVLIYEWVGDR